MDLKTTFNHEYKEGLVHQVVTAYLAGGRQGSKAQKTRAEVSGGGIKPWRQKGTGRARAGSIRSPLWRTGGKIFAAKPTTYKQKVNRKMYRKAINVIISELVRSDRLLVTDDILIKEPRTKALLTQLDKMSMGHDVLILTTEFDTNLCLASRNLGRVEYCDLKTVNPVSLIAHEKVIATPDFIENMKEMLK